jgi:NAD(P)-dependent dehydrogenase (short-subunit alcohol dehydrogenase family)
MLQAWVLLYWQTPPSSNSKHYPHTMKTTPQNPVVLITGALTGIGRATAIAFGREGARVVISDRHNEKGLALEAELRKLGAEAEFVHADVRQEDDVRSLVDQTVQRFGHLDVAVNNAGTEGKKGPITEQSPESYAATFDTNVLGVLLSLKHELRSCLRRRVVASSTFRLPSDVSAPRRLALCCEQTCGRRTH